MGLILLGAILLLIFLEFLFAILGLVAKESFKWGFSRSIGQWVAMILYIFFIFAMELGNKLCRWSDLRRFAGTGVGDQVAVVFK